MQNHVQIAGILNSNCEALSLNGEHANIVEGPVLIMVDQSAVLTVEGPVARDLFL